MTSLELHCLPGDLESLGVLDATLADETTRLEEIVERVLRSPCIAAHVLRLANSPEWSGGMPIDRIDRAVILLGREPLRELGFRLSAVPPAEDPWSRELAARLQRHQIAVSHAAAAVARGARLPLVAEARTAGLIHDIGIQLALARRPEALASAIERSLSERTRLVELERLECDSDHCSEAEELLRTWDVPERLAHAVGFHHDPLAAPREVRYLTMLVYAGECLAKRAGFDDIGDEQLVLEERVLAELRLPPDLLDAHVPAMLDDLARIGIEPCDDAPLEGTR